MLPSSVTLPTLLDAARDPSLPIETFRQCLDNEDLTQLNEQGGNALMMTAARGPMERLPLLLPRFDVNDADQDGLTALMHATIWNNGPMVRALLQAGADPHQATDGGAIALDALLATATPDEKLTAFRGAVQTLRLGNAYMIGRTLPSHEVYAILTEAPVDPSRIELQTLLNELAERDVQRDTAALRAVLDAQPVLPIEPHGKRRL